MSGTEEGPPEESGLPAHPPAEAQPEPLIVEQIPNDQPAPDAQPAPEPQPLGNVGGMSVHQQFLVAILAHQSVTETSPPRIDWEKVSLKIGKLMDTMEWQTNFNAGSCERQFNSMMEAFVATGTDERATSESLEERLSGLVSLMAKRRSGLSSMSSEELAKQVMEAKTVWSKSLMDTSDLGPAELLRRFGEDAEGPDSDPETEELLNMWKSVNHEGFVRDVNQALGLNNEVAISAPTPQQPPHITPVPSTSASAEGMTREAASVSPKLKDLVSLAIAGAAQEDNSKSVSPTSAPTLSKLLELPPRDRGQPLPQIHSLMGSPHSADSSSHPSQGPYYIINQTTCEGIVKPNGVGMPTQKPSVNGINQEQIGPNKKIGQSPGTQDDGSLPGATLTPASKTKVDAEVDFALSSDGPYDLGALVPNLPGTASAFQPAGVVEIAKSATVPCGSAQSSSFSEENISNPSAVPPTDLFETDSLNPELNLKEKSETNATDVPSAASAPSPSHTSLPVVMEARRDIDLIRGYIMDAEESLNTEADETLVESEMSSSSFIDIRYQSDYVEQLRRFDKKKEPSPQGTIKSAEVSPEENPKTSEEDIKQVSESPEKAKTGGGRGKKSLPDKSEEVSPPLTRNFIREKGVAFEETSLSGKRPTKDSSSVSMQRRSITRAGAVTDEEKVIETPPSPTKFSPRKTSSPKVHEVKTPNLRSRRAATPTSPIPPKGDKIKTPSKEGDKKEVDVKEHIEPDATSPQKEVGNVNSEKSSPRKSMNDKEVVSKLEEDSNEEQSDAPAEDDKVSGMEDESCDNDDIAKKKRSRASPRKERSESGEMADDDNSNTAFDGSQKKRLTRRSVKVNTQKQGVKSADKIPGGTSAKESNKLSGKGGKTRKSMSQVRLMAEEAQHILRDSELPDGKRLTRARVKPVIFPANKPKVTAATGSAPASKVATQATVPEQGASSEAERGPTRTTRSRATAAPSTTHSVVDPLPTSTVDSNPSSPSSSITNSTVLDEDKEHKKFRKSIMTVWNKVSTRSYASTFMKPIEGEAAAEYLHIIKKPYDLTKAKRNIESGVTKSPEEFEMDMYLIAMNAIMFADSANRTEFKKAKELQVDVLDYMQEYRGAALKMPKPPGAVDATKKQESEPEAREEEKSKVPPSVKPAGRKRRIPSASVTVDQPETKRRTLRTSTTAATTAASAWQGSRKGKHQVSPDIISSGRTD